MLWDVFLDIIIFDLLEILVLFGGFAMKNFFKIFQISLKYLFVTSSCYFAIDDNGIGKI